MNEILALMRLQVEARFNQALPQVSVSIPSSSTPSNQCTTSEAYDVIGDDFHMGNHMHDDGAIDIVDASNGDLENDALDSVNESFAEAIKDDLLLTLKPMTSTPEAQDVPETVFDIHCTDVGQVCFFVNSNDSLTNIASLALDEKLKLSTISCDYVPMRIIILRWYQNLKITQDLRTNPFQEREIDAYRPGPKQPSKLPRPMPKPPWSLESLPSIFSLEAHVLFGPSGFAAHRLHSFPLSRPCFLIFVIGL